MNERQAAEEFAASLAGSAGGGPSPRTRAGHHAGSGEGGGEGTLMVALAERLGQAGRALPEPGAEFRAELRARLVALAPEVAGARPATVPAQRGRGGRSGARHGSGEGRTRPGFGSLSSAWRRRLLAAGVGVAVATGSVGGIAIASAGAEPGDPLYNAKKIFESLQLSLSGSPTDQGRDYLRLADIRLGEIDSLLQRPDVDLAGSPTQAYLQQTVNELRTMIANGGNLLIGQVRADGDQTALHALADFLLTERQRVADLSWRLPPFLQSQPPQIVALMDRLNRQLQQAAAQQAAQAGHNAQGPGAGAQTGGAGAGGPAGSQDTATTGAAGPDASATASGTPAPQASGSAAAQSSGSAAASASASAGSTIGVSVPLPLPTIGVTVPGLLGLPAIDLGIGDDSSSPTAGQ
ncbi:hypothetical protein KDL01_03450 [Actinospica durhamensis]|uniref:DUF5667 domain-containing protein n=1 Tax=Actinospica durhamensis TaxID=1508375 RepID=A0A941EKP9_9ACTN|nr:DUF5667 domain-containing protein [Actinospica durhamensis]MBR7832297.1 hypothetical protein [Actinospica durhamensis]